MSSNLVVTWPGGIGNPVGERIPTSDIAQTRGGVADTKVIPGLSGGKRRGKRSGSKKSSRKGSCTRKNRKQTRKNRKNRKNRASTRRLCGLMK